MSFFPDIKVYIGNITASSGDNTAGSLAYSFIAWNNDEGRYIQSSSPTIPRRPFSGDVELEGPLPVGSPILIVENRGSHVLVLIEQERYKTTECE